MTHNRLNWYRRRLKRMSPAEVGYRGIVLLWWLGQWVRLSIAGGTARRTGGSGGAARPAQGRPAGVRLFPPGAAARLAPFASRITKTAEAILAHDHTFFDRETINLGAKIDWHRDYRNGIGTPRTLACFIDFRDFSRVGDVKYVWEVSRHQHLVPLAMAYVVSGDARFANEVLAQIDDWIADNPPLHGINWASTENCALRLLDWIMALDLLHGGERGDPIAPGLEARLMRSVGEQVAYLTHNYSLFSSANNHLLTELAAVHLAHLFFGIGSDRDRRRIARRLESEMLLQNHPDGVNREQALAYQGFIFDILYLPWCAAQTNRLDDFSARYGERLERMAAFIADTTDAAFAHPAVGDEDSGRAYWLGQESGERTLSILNTAAAAWPQLIPHLPPGRPADPKSALLGAAPTAQSPGAERRSFSFAGYADGGYYVFRAGPPAAEVLLLFDAGDLGYRSIAAHGHADALSLWLHVGSLPVFVDSGTYSYIDGERRRKYKSTAGHNTLTFDGSNQSEYLDRFIWGTPHAVLRRSGRPDERGARAEGEIRWATGELHSRSVRFDSETAEITVIDRWRGRKAPVIRFHLDPRLEARLAGGHVVITRSDFAIDMESTAPVSLERATISPRLYTEAETSVVTLRPDSAAGECTTRIRLSLPAKAGAALSPGEPPSSSA